MRIDANRLLRMHSHSRCARLPEGPPKCHAEVVGPEELRVI